MRNDPMHIDLAPSRSFTMLQEIKKVAAELARNKSEKGFEVVFSKSKQKK